MSVRTETGIAAAAAAGSMTHVLRWRTPLENFVEDLKKCKGLPPATKVDIEEWLTIFSATFPRIPSLDEKKMEALESLFFFLFSFVRPLSSQPDRERFEKELHALMGHYLPKGEDLNALLLSYEAASNADAQLTQNESSYAQVAERVLQQAAAAHATMHAQVEGLKKQAVAVIEGAEKQKATLNQQATALQERVSKTADILRARREDQAKAVESVGAALAASLALHAHAKQVQE